MLLSSENIDFERLLNSSDARRSAITDIFADEKLSRKFIEFILLSIKRGKARKVIDFIERNALDETSPQLLQPLCLAYEKLGKKLNAAKVCAQLAELAPTNGEILFDAARLFYDAGKFDEALPYLSAALKFSDEKGEIYFLLGNVFKQKKEFERALENYKLALQNGIRRKASAYYNIGVVYENLFQYEGARENYELAIDEDVNLAIAHWNLSLILLRSGEYENGWREFEWRKKKSDYVSPNFNWPECKKGELKNSRILLYAEQGFGDAIQFLRFVKNIRSASISIVVKKELKRLFEKSGFFDKVYSREGKPDESEFDCFASLLSMPYLLGLKNVGLEKPLWQFPKTNTRQNTLKIGIAWKGNPAHENDKFRSMNLNLFLSAFNDLHAEIYSLQKGIISDEENRLLSENNVVRADMETNDFYDAAQIIGGLDAVVSVDTAVAHLAASMFVPTFILLPKNSDWRWGTEDKKNDWYSTVKLFRQKELGNWNEPLLKLKVALLEFVNAKANLSDEEDLAKMQAEVFEKAALLEKENKQTEALEVLKNVYENGIKTNEMIFNLALAYHKNNELNKARTLYEKLIDKISSEEVYYNYLLLLLQINEPEFAERVGMHVVADFPNSAKINFIFANILKANEKFNDAETYYKRAIALAPDFDKAKFNLASLYYATGRIYEAKNIYEELLRGNIAADLLYNYGLIYQELNEFEKAIEYLNAAIRLENRAEFHLAKAEVLLALGDFENGLQEYEARLLINKGACENKIPQSLAGLGSKKILIYEEQGIGDTIQFIRYAKALAQNNFVTIATRDALVNYLSEQNIFDNVITLSQCDGENYDYVIPIVSLLKLFYESGSTFEINEKYLNAGRINFHGNNKLKIGIAWRGNPYPVHQRKRHLKLQALEKIFAENDAEFYPLQNNPTKEEIEIFNRRENFVYNPDYLKTFSGLASLINSMDFVITVDTVYAHLAGALGKKTFLLLHYSPDWRWSERTNIAWYRSVEAVRQKEYGNWESAINELVNKIKNELK